MFNGDVVVDAKEFGRYRVKLIKTTLDSRVLITDKRSCDRTVVKIYATDGRQCFSSVTFDAISFLESFIETKDVESMNNFVHLLNGYIYGIIDLVSTLEWFNPHARPQC